MNKDENDLRRMYGKLSKKELISMLIERNRLVEHLLGSISDVPVVTSQSLLDVPHVPYLEKVHGRGCRDWSDCINPAKDCLDCPLRYKTTMETSTIATPLPPEPVITSSMEDDAMQ